MNYYEKLDYDFFASVGPRAEFPAHYHEKTELLWLREGSREMLIGDTIYTLSAGDLAVIFPNVIHAYPIENPPENNVSVMVILNTAFSANYQRTLLQSTPICPVIRAADLHPDLVYAIKALAGCAREDKEAIGVYFQLFIMRFLRSAELSEMREPLHGDLIHRLVTYLSEHYLEEVTLDTIAAALNYDKYRISRILSNELHTSLSDYINEMRVNEAKKLIAATDLPLAEISLACGFANSRTFNRNFAARAGMTPREYRKSVV